MYLSKNNFIDRDLYELAKAEIMKNKYNTEEEYNKLLQDKYMNLGGRLLRPQIILDRSPLKYKKWRVWLPDGSHVDYGDSRYEDYLIHKDVERKNAYRNRHKHDNIENPTYPGFWSWWHLWTYQDGKKAWRNAEAKALKYFLDYK